MGDIIDFASGKARPASQFQPQPAPEQPFSQDGCELTYEPKENSVGVSVLTGDDGVIRFNVTAPAADVTQAIEVARATLLANFGVMPGDEQAAQALLEQMGEAGLNGFVTTFVQRHFLAKALLRTNVMPFLEPDLLTSEPPVAGQDYTFRVDALERPFFALSSYEPVKVRFPEKTRVTSKDVSAYLDNMAEELGTWEPDSSREAVAEGDRVQLNLDSTVDGRPFPGLTGRHVPYMVGTQSIGPEFDQQLVGMKPRERKEFSVSVPAPAEDGTLTFQVLQVKVQIDEILRKVPARIDDAWVAQNLPEAQTLLGLRSRIRDVLERDTEAAFRSQLMDLCTDELAKRLEGDPDERYVLKMRDELVAQLMGDLDRQGIDFQQFLGQPGFDAEAWERQMTEDARLALRRGLALDSLADHLDLQLEEKDIAAVVGQMAPGREQEAYQSLLESGQMHKLCEVALRARASEWLADHAKDASGPKLQLV